MLHYCKTVVSWILMSYVSISWKRVTFLFISILVAREDDSYYYLVFSSKKLLKIEFFFNYVTSLVLSYYFTVRWYDERFYFHKNFVKLSLMTLKDKNFSKKLLWKQWKAISRKKNTFLLSRVNGKWFHEIFCYVLKRLYYSAYFDFTEKIALNKVSSISQKKIPKIV